ncbi:MAG: restriction endonuclease subunit S [Oscillatoria sp. PMC 1051.18]|nr:restriction endonuclease subunit S [Oscillatoria sp. PMC 1051.18]
MLEKIRIERQRQYLEECENAKKKAHKKPKAYKQNIEPIETSDLPDLPNTWKWERFVNIANILGGVTKGRKFKDRETIKLPYLRVANVQDGYLNLDEIKEIEVLPEDQEKYHLENGDILVTEGGDRDKLGRGTIWRCEIDNCIHQNHVYRARLYYSSVPNEYIDIALKSESSRSFFFKNASQSVNLASINMTMLGSVPLPIPPEKEQQEIVKRVETLFQKADQIEQRYYKAKAYVDKLTQSILAKAFRGELVPQDPNDEPASVLLERIRTERAKQEAEAKPAKKSKKGSKGGRKKKPAEPKQLDIPGINVS